MLHANRILSFILTGALTIFFLGCSLHQTSPRAAFIVPPYLLAENCDWASAALLPDGSIQMIRTSLDPQQIRHSLWQSADQGQSWTKLRDLDLPFFDPGGLSFNDLLLLQNNQLLLSAHRGLETLHNGGLPVVSFSHDGGKTWSNPKTVRPLAEDDVYYKINDRAIQLNSGRIVLPAARAVDRNAYEGATNESLLFFSDDNGQTWTRSNPTSAPDILRGMQEPCVVELSDHRLMILARTGSGSHHLCYSSDMGKTWTAPKPTSLLAGCSPITLKKMPDGRLIVFYNHGTPPTPGDLFPRFPLHYAVSKDNGAHWSKPVIVDEAPLPPAPGADKNARREFDYTSVCFLYDGILLTYGDELYRRKCCVIEYPK